ncbi:MAG: sulfatase [Acidobacteriota bacterium]
MPNGRRRIVLIVADTLRADSLGAYGGVEPTPHIDRLSRDATLYETARSNAPWTLPSMASLMTGMLPSEVGAAQMVPAIRPEAQTLAERLHVAGFSSWAISANPTLLPSSGIPRGFDRFEVARAVMPGPEVTSRAVSWLREPALPDRLLLYLHYMEPHDPYHPAEGSGEITTADLTAAAAKRQRITPSRSQVELLRHRYQQDVLDLDISVSAALHEARRAGARIVLTADHGEEFFEHGSFKHGQSLYDELLRVPLLVTGSGAERIDRAVTLTVVAPMLLSAATEPHPAIASVVSEPRHDRAETVASVPGRVRLVRLCAAWADGYKAIRDLDTGEVRFYELPREEVPVVPPEATARALDELTKPWSPPPRSSDPPAELEQRLRELGYVQ